MKFFTRLLTSVTLVTAAFAQTNSVDSYIASQSPIAKAGVLANIGGSGSKAQGAKVSLCLNLCPTYRIVLILV